MHFKRNTTFKIKLNLRYKMHKLYLTEKQILEVEPNLKGFSLARNKQFINFLHLRNYFQLVK